MVLRIQLSNGYSSILEVCKAKDMGGLHLPLWMICAGSSSTFASILSILRRGETLLKIPIRTVSISSIRVRCQSQLRNCLLRQLLQGFVDISPKIFFCLLAAFYSTFVDSYDCAYLMDSSTDVGGR